MSWDFLTWILVFILQAGLLGKSMFTMISLTDLEADNINPFDCAEQVNKFVLVEYGAHFVMTACLLLAQKWFTAFIHVGLAAMLANLWAKKQVYMHAADAFKQLKAFKSRRFVIFGVYCASFVLVTYRLIESGLHTVLTQEGRATAKKLTRRIADPAHMQKLFRDAATSLHNF